MASVGESAGSGLPAARRPRGASRILRLEPEPAGRPHRKRSPGRRVAARDPSHLADRGLPGGHRRALGPGRRVRRGLLHVLGGRGLQLPLRPAGARMCCGRTSRPCTTRAAPRVPAGAGRSPRSTTTTTAATGCCSPPGSSGRGQVRWVVRTPRVSWEILLRGGRRQLVDQPRLLLAALRGGLSGMGIGLGALARGSSPPLIERGRARAIGSVEPIDWASTGAAAGPADPGEAPVER